MITLEEYGEITIPKEVEKEITEKNSFYILYNEYNAKAILTDDGELIKLCKLVEIPFINSLASITRMFEKGILTHTEACEYLQKLNDYGRYSKEVYNYFKQEVNCP